MVKKCPSCGAEMEQAFVKGSSLETWFCPNLYGNIVRSTSGRPERILIPCGNVDSDSLEATFTVLMLEGLNKATKGAISNAKLMEQVNKAVGGGIDPSQIFMLFRNLTKLGMAVGMQPKDSVESGIGGILNQSRNRLAKLGIYMWAKDAYEAYPELNRKEAWIKYSLDNVRENVEN